MSKTAQRFDETHRFDPAPFLVPPGARVSLDNYDPAYTAQIKDKHEGQQVLAEDVGRLTAMQELLWASRRHAVLIILQAMDAAGKDGVIKHVMTGFNPQGCEVHSFKAPSEEERDHHFLWRPARVAPARGRIAIFNRSYYEEVLVVRIHPEFLDSQWLAPHVREMPQKDLWKRRYSEISTFEEMLTDNGVEIIKFYLHLSAEEQRERFLSRLDTPEKRWKFSARDVEERRHWDDYRAAIEDMLAATSTKEAPWYVIPADHKWFTRACVADIVTSRMAALNLAFPEVTKEQQAELKAARGKLTSGNNGAAAKRTKRKKS